MDRGKRFKALSSVLMILCLLFVAACSGGAEQTTSESNQPKETGAASPGQSTVPTEPAKKAKPYEGVTLKMLRHSGYDADWMAEQVAAFKAETGIDVKFDLVPYSQLHNKQVVELASKSGTYDMIAVPDFWLAEYNEGGWLQPLNGYLKDPKLYKEEFKINDIPQSLLDSNSIGGNLLALPWKFNINVLFYRSDLISKPPATWDELKQVAQQQTKDGKYGVGFSLSKSSLSQFFLDLVYSNGGQLLSNDLKTATLNSPQGVEALDFLKSMLPYAANGALNRHWDESASLMAQGKTTMDMLVPFQAAVVDDQQKSLVVGKVKYARVPSKVKSAAKVNTWGLAVTAGSKNKEASYLFIQYLFSPEKLKKMTLDLTGSIIPSRSSVINDAEMRQKYPQFVAADEGVKDGYAYPKIAEISSIEEIIATTVQKALNNELSSKDALDQAAKQINDLLKK